MARTACKRVSSATWPLEQKIKTYPVWWFALQALLFSMLPAHSLLQHGHRLGQQLPGAMLQLLGRGFASQPAAACDGNQPPPEIPPFDYKPVPYTGPSKEEVLALRKKFLSPCKQGCRARECTLQPAPCVDFSRPSGMHESTCVSPWMQ